MKRLNLRKSRLVLVGLFIPVVWTNPAWGAMNKCVGHDGKVTYTEQPCEQGQNRSAVYIAPSATSAPVSANTPAPQPAAAPAAGKKPSKSTTTVTVMKNDAYCNLVADKVMRSPSGSDAMKEASEQLRNHCTDEGATANANKNMKASERTK